jgi:hypothetical protein
MVGFILLGTGVVSMVATAKAASRVTEAEQDKAVGKVEQKLTEARSAEDAA